MRVTLCVVGRLRQGPERALIDDYLTRFDRTGRTSKMEGKDVGDWVLIDTGDVIVHVFRPEVREFYQLEKMWLPADRQPGATA